MVRIGTVALWGVGVSVFQCGSPPGIVSPPGSVVFPSGECLSCSAWEVSPPGSVLLRLGVCPQLYCVTVCLAQLSERVSVERGVALRAWLGAVMFGPGSRSALYTAWVFHLAGRPAAFFGWDGSSAARLQDGPAVSCWALPYGAAVLCLLGASPALPLLWPLHGSRRAHGPAFFQPVDCQPVGLKCLRSSLRSGRIWAQLRVIRS